MFLNGQKLPTFQQFVGRISCISFLSAQVLHATKEDEKYLNRSLERLKKSKQEGLIYYQLDKETAKLIFFAATLFALNENKKSQLGYTITTPTKN